MSIFLFEQVNAGLKLCALTLFLGLLSTASAAPLDCGNNNCNLYSKGTYPNLVLGKVNAVATDDQAVSVYRWAKQHNYWPTLPNNEADFLKYVQVISVSVSGGRDPVEFTLLMAREEFDVTEIFPGDYVRYTPHTISEPRSQTYDGETARIYWDLFGCIAVLCRADDPECPNQYTDGIYRRSDGVALMVDGSTPKEPAHRIDTETYFPL